MHPILFHIGSFPVRSFGVLMMLGVAAGMFWATRRATRFGADPNRIWDSAFWMIMFGVLGARIVFIAQEWGYYSDPAHRSELFSIQFSGLTSFGGLIFGLLALIVWARVTKTPLWPLLDTLAAPFLLAHAIGRVGCLLNGCCHGGRTTGPLGVHIENMIGLYQPAQIYDSLMTLIGIAALLWYERQPRPGGRSLGLALVIYGLSRFFYEFWRAGSSSTYMGSLPVTEAQVMALVLSLFGLTIFALRGRATTVARPDQAPTL